MFYAINVLGMKYIPNLTNLYKMLALTFYIIHPLNKYALLWYSGHYGSDIITTKYD